MPNYVKQAHDHRVELAEDASSVRVDMGDYNLLIEAVCVTLPDPYVPDGRILQPHMLITKLQEESDG